MIRGRDAAVMLGSISADLLPTDDPGTAARHEPVAASPLLRDRGAGSVGPALGAAASGPAAATVDRIAAQLAPIQSHEALASSYSREANPEDPTVQAAYACAWAELAFRLSFGTTRRARHRATFARGRVISR